MKQDVDMESETRSIYRRRLNKGYTSKFSEGHLDREMPEKGWITQRLKRFDNNSNKDEDKSPILNNSNVK